MGGGKAARVGILCGPWSGPWIVVLGGLCRCCSRTWCRVAEGQAALSLPLSLCDLCAVQVHVCLCDRPLFSIQRAVSRHLGRHLVHSVHRACFSPNVCMAFCRPS